MSRDSIGASTPRGPRGPRGPCDPRGLSGWIVPVLLAATLLAGCAAPAGLRAVDGAAAQAPVPHFGVLRLAGQEIETEWHLPAAAGGTAGATALTAEPAAWLLLQHGFARRCANLRHLAAHLAREAGVATLCLNAEMAGGNPALAEALAHWLASDTARAPDGRSAPARLLVGGFSAGGAFAARVGERLAGPDGAADRLAGALLFDPVGGAAMGRSLVAISAAGQRPVLALMAPPSRCNAGQLGAQALAAVRVAAQGEGQAEGTAAVQAPASAAVDPAVDPAGAGSTPPFVGVVFTAGTHVDAEGPDTEALAVRACREGWPQPAVVQALRSLAAVWTQHMLGPQAAFSAQARSLAHQRLDGRVGWTEIE
jgi:hypothetical protein